MFFSFETHLKVQDTTPCLPLKRRPTGWQVFRSSLRLVSEEGSRPSCAQSLKVCCMKSEPTLSGLFPSPNLHFSTSGKV